MFWDDDADRLLIELWSEGGSLGFVADGMRKAGYVVSRNAVAGRKHRLKAIVQLTRASKTTTKVITTKRRPSEPRQRKKIVNEKRTETKNIAALAALAENEGVDYLELTPFGCKAIIDRPRGGEWMLQKVCGLPRYNGGPYCRGHFNLYTYPQQLRRANG